MECSIQLPVPAAVESVADRLTAAGGDRGDATEGGERGFVADPTGVRPGHQELGGGDCPNAGLVEQLGASSGDELLQLAFVLGSLGFQEQRPAGDGTDGAHRGAVLDRV